MSSTVEITTLVLVSIMFAMILIHFTVKWFRWASWSTDSVVLVPDIPESQLLQQQRNLDRARLGLPPLS